MLGLTDIAVRKNVLTLLGGDVLTFTVPWKMFLAMEANVPDSLTGCLTWRTLTSTLPAPGGEKQTSGKSQ
jgi:hypothetical protein